MADPKTTSSGSAAAASQPAIKNRTATASWQGDLRDGKGTVSTESGVLEKVSYSYETRFENGKAGTNPEELLAAAHAGCFTMSVAASLGKKGFQATSLHTRATITLEGLAITRAHLSITGLVSGISEEEFKAITDDSAQNCVMSKALKVPVTSDARVTK